MAGGIRQYSWAIDLFGILACAFFLAKVTSVYLAKSIEMPKSVGMLKASDMAPSQLARKNADEYAIIIDRNIFDSTPPSKEGEGELEAAAEEVAGPSGEAVPTSLSVNVLGVLVVGDGTDARSSATIAGGGAPAVGRGKAGADTGAKVYAVGDTESFAPNTVLTRIQPDRIEFTNSGRLEYAEVLPMGAASIFGPPAREPIAATTPPKEAAPGALIRKEEPGKFTVDQREVQDALQNLDKLYTEIRAVPNFSGGKVSGMKILSVKSDSIFAKLGLRRGDVLQKINGMELDVKKGFEIFSALKDEKQISLDLIRGGQPTTVEYEIR
ncbi:MAG: hypothetical protein JXA24_01720 [Proteobacteria bacterium]|nr:hypothetical protein [Pseudomonadota bacterium]